MGNKPSSFIKIIDSLLLEHGLHPVLVDIGASGPPRDTWNLIARHSIFIGFDPDLRAISELTGTGFHRAVMINEAVTAQNTEKVLLYLTKSPYCSSTLRPDLPALANYYFVDSFEVQREVEVPATSLPAVLDKLALNRVDWFKTDSQGTDLRLFNSLSGAIRENVLCVELEPGLIDAYRGEDHFIDAHRDLLAQGFWLSEARICGTARIQKSSMDHLLRIDPGINRENIRLNCPESPGWIEASYLRSVDHLVKHSAPLRDFLLLWVFAVMHRQWGFALDVSLACRKIHAESETTRTMTSQIEKILLPAPRQTRRTFISVLKSIIPISAKQWIKSHIK